MTFFSPRSGFWRYVGTPNTSGKLICYDRCVHQVFPVILVTVSCPSDVFIDVPFNCGVVPDNGGSQHRWNFCAAYYFHAWRIYHS